LKKNHENWEQGSNQWQLRSGLLLTWSWAHAQGDWILPHEEGEFHLTCFYCPKWVTTLNSISAICCPLEHFWTAAWLWCQLLTGNKA
jgi:hypothetical protein